MQKILSEKKYNKILNEKYIYENFDKFKSLEIKINKDKKADLTKMYKIYKDSIEPLFEKFNKITSIKSTQCLEDIKKDIQFVIKNMNIKKKPEEILESFENINNILNNNKNQHLVYVTHKDKIIKTQIISLKELDIDIKDGEEVIIEDLSNGRIITADQTSLDIGKPIFNFKGINEKYNIWNIIRTNINNMKTVNPNTIFKILFNMHRKIMDFDFKGPKLSMKKFYKLSVSV
ncbi:hypothetical protein ACFL4O_00600 [bacterium]